MTAAALREYTVFDPEAPIPSREVVLARYHRLREIVRHHHSEVMDFLPKDAIHQNGRRLGLTSGRVLVADSLEDLNLAIDLAIHTAPPDRTRAIDRYARSGRWPSGSEEAIMLEVMRNARFAIIVAKRRHPSVGLIVSDVLRQSELWLVDEGLEATLPPGAAFASRFYAPGPFVMNSGVGVPVGGDMVVRAVKSAPSLMRKSSMDLPDDRRFAEAIYRQAIAEGATARVEFRDSDEVDEDAA